MEATSAHSSSERSSRIRERNLHAAASARLAEKENAKVKELLSAEREDDFFEVLHPEKGRIVIAAREFQQGELTLIYR